MVAVLLSAPFHVAIPPLIAVVVALGFSVWLIQKLNAQKTGKDVGHPDIDELALQVKSGAKAFLKAEYRYLAVFVVLLTVILLAMYWVKPIYDDSMDGVRIAVAFFFGAFLSASAGYLGMMVATDGNSRTTAACASGTLNDGLTVAFTAGAVMGFTVVGLGLFGVSAMYWALNAGTTPPQALQLLSGFGFGASSIALFARVAGGIYTKAADVGADLVGKVEAGIDEDDPHNPAVIADNVGDNVGDVAGMGADLFESYVGSIVASATLGVTAPAKFGMDPDMMYQFIALPFWLSAAGVIASVLGYFAVSTKEEGKGWDVKLSTLMWALEKGMFVAGGVFVIAALIIVVVLFGIEQGWKLYVCIIIGLVAGMAIGKVTEYFTSFDFGPVISIKDRGTTGPATVVIQGLGVGMISCVPPTIILVIAIIACDSFGGGYGVSIAAVGMLATLGITLATDAYGPVADNAGGLAEMAGLDASVRNKTDSLDALGNTTAATGKGFAIGSAVLTSLSLLAAFKEQVSTDEVISFDLGDPVVLSGLLFGAMLPMLFAALTMISVGKAAAEIIQEVRRQFDEVKNANGDTLRSAIEKASAGVEIPKHEDVKPDSDKCVEISTNSSVKEMIAPGSYAILAPLFIGFTVGPKCLMGMLAGALVCGCMMAILMSNAGGAWDNSKKLCEKLKIKKTDQGKACIVGDTVGDPFKDTSGPALNILIKLMSMVSLTIAPLIRGNKSWDNWYFGCAPLAVFVIVTGALVITGVLTWKDPLDKFSNKKPNSE